MNEKLYRIKGNEKVYTEKELRASFTFKWKNKNGSITVSTMYGKNEYIDVARLVK